MIFTLPTKQVLPIVALLSCLIANHGINAFDFEMDVTPADEETLNTNKSNDNNLRTKDRDGVRKLTEDIRPAKGTKIIGGDAVDPGEYPWFARAVYSIPFFGEIWWGCGASLVTPEFILSAAHCGWDTSARMQVGALCEPYGPGADKNCGQKIETIKVDKVYDHPNYDPVSSDFDFSLLRLVSRSTIEPVKMDMDNTSNGFVDGKIVYPIGVGTTKSGASIFPDNVEDVAVPYVDNPSCNSKYGPGSITPAMMCAGDLKDGGEDACQGDSGGPLYDKDSETLVGVTSWGIGCGLKTFPGVYARISNQWEAWIKPTICENHSAPKPEFCGGPPPPPPSSCEDDGEDTFKFSIKTDRYGGDISWGLKERVDGNFEDYYGPIGALGGEPYGNEKVYTETVCLPKDTCYKFIIFDSYGDGLCCRWGEGGYQIEFNDDILKQTRFEDSKTESVEFGSC